MRSIIKKILNGVGTGIIAGVVAAIIVFMGMNNITSLGVLALTMTPAAFMILGILFLIGIICFIISAMIPNNTQYIIGL